MLVCVFFTFVHQRTLYLSPFQIVHLVKRHLLFSEGLLFRLSINILPYCPCRGMVFSLGYQDTYELYIPYTSQLSLDMSRFLCLGGDTPGCPLWDLGQLLCKAAFDYWRSKPTEADYIFPSLTGGSYIRILSSLPAFLLTLFVLQILPAIFFRYSVQFEAQADCHDFLFRCSFGILL